MTAELVLAQVRDFHRSWGERPMRDLEVVALWEELGDIIGIPTCACGCPPWVHIGEVGCPCGMPDEPPCSPAEALASQTPQRAPAGVRYCEDCDGFGVFQLTLNNPGVRCASCNGSGRA